MAGKSRKQAVVVAAVLALGTAALTGCTTTTAKPQPKTLTTAAAAAYYLSTTCNVDAKGQLFTAAITVAAQSSSSTGPALDSLDAAAQAYLTATQDAASSLDNPKAPWPTSVRKSIKVMRDQYMAELPALETMSGAQQMADAATAYSQLPDTTKASAASKLIRSKLGLPSLNSPKACPPPPALTVAPATGLLITGTGYTFHAPTGWTLPQHAVQGDEDSYAISAKADAKGFYDTINVILGDPVTDPLDVFEQGSVEYLEQAQAATHVEIRPRVTVAGTVAVHMSSLQTHQGHAAWAEQFRVTRDGTGYTMTFDFDPSESQAAREALAESVLASWSWT